jgi:hypothetical protein
MKDGTVAKVPIMQGQLAVEPITKVSVEGCDGHSSAFNLRRAVCQCPITAIPVDVGGYDGSNGSHLEDITV